MARSLSALPRLLAAAWIGASASATIAQEVSDRWVILPTQRSGEVRLDLESVVRDGDQATYTLHFIGTRPQSIVEKQLITGRIDCTERTRTPLSGESFYKDGTGKKYPFNRPAYKFQPESVTAKVADIICR